MRLRGRAPSEAGTLWFALLPGHNVLCPSDFSLEDSMTWTAEPLFMRPKDEYLMGFGILPAYPRHLLDEALPRLNLASQAAMMMGGKRYLSGSIAFQPAEWKAHYGEVWPTVTALKKKYNPQGILNPGFIKYE